MNPSQDEPTLDGVPSPEDLEDGRTPAAGVAQLKAEIERLRQKNRELNRRLTRAEGAIETTVEDCQRQGVSMGRALANSAATKYKDESEKLSAVVDRCTALCKRWETVVPGTPELCQKELAKAIKGE